MQVSFLGSPASHHIAQPWPEVSQTSGIPNVDVTGSQHKGQDASFAKQNSVILIIPESKGFFSF